VPVIAGNHSESCGAEMMKARQWNSINTGLIEKII
jgi:hypothetical protein